MGSSVQSFTAPLRFFRKIPSQSIVGIFVPSKSKRKRTYPVFSFKDSSSVIRAFEKEIRLGYWPHVDFSWTDTVRTANELSAVHSRDLPIRAMDLFHIAIACETRADEFLTFDEDQANLARAAGLPVWKGKNAQHA